MRSKAEVIRTDLAGLRVLDIGGVGYERSSAYETELSSAWSVCKARFTVDASPKADMSIDLNALPLPQVAGTYDIATAFDILEHLEHPAEVLRWIPCNKLIVTVPNALSPITRRMEEKGGSKHLYSFTRYTASILLGESGWGVVRCEYQFGKWSLATKAINFMGSLAPSRYGTSIVLHCDRNTPQQQWLLR